jgi:hypothetical protein
VNYGFASNLEHLFRRYNAEHTGSENSTLDAWIYGHTHHNGDTVIQGTRVVANQRGYMPDVCAGYRADAFIDLRPALLSHATQMKTATIADRVRILYARESLS